MSELLPCPFCGGEAGMYNTCEMAIVECKKCCVHSKGYTSEAKAIQAWNSRVERTCHNTNENRWFRCSACGFGFTDWYLEDESDIDEQPRYCPNCGARVIHKDVKLVDGTAKIVGYQDGYVIVVDE